jgi:GntR family transcriptional regulator
MSSKTTFSKKKKTLLSYLENQKFAGNKLPPEEKLAEYLNVSRGTVREILSVLSQEGVISKKHGLGNFVHKSTIDANMRIDMIRDFNELIKDGGFEPEMFVSRPSLVTDKHLAEFPEIDCGSPDEVLGVETLYKADGIPAIYSKNLIPKSIILLEPETDLYTKKENTIFDFLARYCNQHIENTLIRFDAVICDELLMDKFEFKTPRAMTCWKEYYYNIYDDLVSVVTTYFNQDIMNYSILRKGINP